MPAGITYGLNNNNFNAAPPDTPGDNKRKNQPYILDLVTRDRLFLQTIPQSLDYDPDSSWVAIASPGRNNPLYHYTGSEDTLEFTITWFANDDDREDVLKKCKWLESLTKNNGYDEKPHAIQFIFGQLFTEAKWIVSNAKYKMSLFHRDLGMLPQLASQEVCLKRITDTNRTRLNILRVTT